MVLLGDGLLLWLCEVWSCLAMAYAVALQVFVWLGESLLTLLPFYFFTFLPFYF